MSRLKLRYDSEPDHHFAVRITCCGEEYVCPLLVAAAPLRSLRHGVPSTRLVRTWRSPCRVRRTGSRAFSHRRMSLNWGSGAGEAGAFLFCLMREEEIVGAVGMWETQERFPRAVGGGGKPARSAHRLAMAVFHGRPRPGISTALGGLKFGSGQALSLAMWRRSWRLARCISSAASVSDCSLANKSSSARLRPGRKKFLQSGTSAQ